MQTQSWYYGSQQQPTGPVTLEQLKGLVAAGQLPPETFVWTQGMPHWTAAGSVEVLYGPNHASETAMNLLAPVGPQSVVSFIAGYLGLLSLLIWPLGLFAVLLGIMGWSDLAKHPEKHGKPRAIVGMVGGAIGVLGTLFVIVGMFTK